MFMKYAQITKYLQEYKSIDLKAYIENHPLSKNPGHDFEVYYKDLNARFMNDVESLVSNNKELDGDNYFKHLQEHKIEWETRSMEKAKIENADDIFLFSLIVAAVRTDHFESGNFCKHVENGSIARWLEALKKLDK